METNPTIVLENSADKATQSRHPADFIKTVAISNSVKQDFFRCKDRRFAGCPSM
jgi:hypothetical protein